MSDWCMPVADYLPMILLSENDCVSDMKFESFKKRWKIIVAALTGKIVTRQAQPASL